MNRGLTGWWLVDTLVVGCELVGGWWSYWLTGCLAGWPAGLVGVVVCWFVSGWLIGWSIVRCLVDVVVCWLVSGWLIGWSIACMVAWLACRCVGCWLVGLMIGWSAGVWLLGCLFVVSALAGDGAMDLGHRFAALRAASRVGWRFSHSPHVRPRATVTPWGGLIFFSFFFRGACLLGC